MWIHLCDPLRKRPKVAKVWESSTHPKTFHHTHWYNTAPGGDSCNKNGNHSQLGGGTLWLFLKYLFYNACAVTWNNPYAGLVLKYYKKFLLWKHFISTCKCNRENINFCLWGAVKVNVWLVFCGTHNILCNFNFFPLFCFFVLPHTTYCTTSWQGATILLNLGWCYKKVQMKHA